MGIGLVILYFYENTNHFLIILGVISSFWVNDAIFGFTVLLKAMPFIYTGAVFFLAYFSIRQGVVFAFNNAELVEISDLLEHPLTEDKKKTARLSNRQLAVSSEKLNQLMVEGQIFLNNDLSLPSLANELGLSIHDTSYLINKLTGGNFYNYITSLGLKKLKNCSLPAV